MNKNKIVRFQSLIHPELNISYTIKDGYVVSIRVKNKETNRILIIKTSINTNVPDLALQGAVDCMAAGKAFNRGMI